MIMSKRKVVDLGLIVFIILLLTMAIKVYPIVERGYDMYHEAVNEVSLEEKIAEIRSDENYIELEDISKEYRDMVIESEDSRFYSHLGIDPIAITRAAYEDIKAGAFVQGGSTITQQLGKNMYFSFEKKYERKVAEVFLAFDLEGELTKDEILELYCNIAYFGEGCYGLKEASEHYYSVTPKDLFGKQAEILVNTLKSPNNYNPNKMKIKAFKQIILSN